MTEKLAIWAAAASLLCTSALVPTAQADPVPLERATLQGDEVIQTPIGDIELVDNYFDDDAAKRLFDEMNYQRAAQSYIWSTPLVSITTWRDNQGTAYGVESDTDFVVLESLKRHVHQQIFAGDDELDYAFTGTDPEALDNVWLRGAAERQIP